MKSSRFSTTCFCSFDPNLVLHVLGHSKHGRQIQAGKGLTALDGRRGQIQTLGPGSTLPQDAASPIECPIPCRAGSALPRFRTLGTTAVPPSASRQSSAPLLHLLVHRYFVERGIHLPQDRRSMFAYHSEPPR